MRLLFAFLAALFICIAIFFGMHLMTHTESKEFKKTENKPNLVYLANKTNKELQIKEKRKKPKKPPKKEPPKKVKLQKIKIVPKITKKVEVKTFKPVVKKVDVSPVISDINLSNVKMQNDVVKEAPIKKVVEKAVEKAPVMEVVDANSLSIIKRVIPRYPRLAKRRNTEGYVRVSFTVTKSGSVKNARIIDAKPKGVFDKASLKAIKKFRFKAQKVARNAILKFNFRLTK